MHNYYACGRLTPLITLSTLDRLITGDIFPVLASNTIFRHLLAASGPQHESAVIMKAVVITRFCETLDEVQVADVPLPQPKSTEVLIKVIAAGVNFVDTLYVRAPQKNSL